MDLIDTHAHLESIERIDEALERAENVGVRAVIAMGSDYESNLWVLEESAKHERKNLRIFRAIGLHPWGLDPSRIDVNFQFIEKNEDKTTAIGEIGLDYWYKEVRKNADKKELQKGLFRRLLEMAKKNDKPVSIHSRGAWKDCADICIEVGVRKAVFHWFSGPSDTLRNILDQGYYVSATPAIAYSREHREVVENTPLDNLLMETDSPVTYSGEISEPAHVLKCLRAVAQLKNEKEEKVAEKSTENARLIFGI